MPTPQTHEETECSHTTRNEADTELDRLIEETENGQNERAAGERMYIGMELEGTQTPIQTREPEIRIPREAEMDYSKCPLCREPLDRITVEQDGVNITQYYSRQIMEEENQDNFENFEFDQEDKGDYYEETVNCGHCDRTLPEKFREYFFENN